MRPRVRLVLELRRALRAAAPPLLAALPALYWAVEATRRASYAPLGRDQGIFQYVAWAWLRGERGYAEVRDVNGPLTPMIHMIFLGLGGRDEHRFRVLDLAVTGASFALVGACLPGICRPYAAGGWRTAREVSERAGWAIAAWVVLTGQYLQYIFWDTAQRESFFDWFLAGSVGLTMMAQRRMAAASAARGHATSLLLATGGALSAITWLGKPTYAAFTLVQAAALLADDDSRMPRPRRLAVFAGGALLGLAIPAAVLWAYADPAAFARVYFVDVPAMYRFIWPRTPWEILTLESQRGTLLLSAVTSTVMLGLVLRRWMPRRALSLALLPLVAVASVVAQAKGFPYHFHPVTLGLHLQWLAIVVFAWEKVRTRVPPTSGWRLVPALAGGALALRVALALQHASYMTAPWGVDAIRTEAYRESEAHLAIFRITDFRPWSVRQVARYLRDRTGPDERVQIYGMDPYILFLAERLGATPYIYDYDLNADHALAGSHLDPPAGLHPTPREAGVIRDLRDAHERDLVARMRARPPAAVVFLDGSPLLTIEDAARDFELHSPEAWAWIRANYTETASFQGYRVWLRSP